MPEIITELDSLTETVHFAEPHFGFLDVDETLLYKGQDPTALPQTIELMSKLATPAHKLYLTFNTQHLADLPKYKPLWDLCWQLPNGAVISPPICLEMGLVIGTFNQKTNKVDHEFGQHHLFNAQAYAENTRPKIIKLIEATFPDLVTFESGKVLIGAQILPEAVEKFGPDPKAMMKPKLEAALAKQGLDKLAFAISAGTDLDIAPKIVQMRGKRFGLVTFYKKLQQIFPDFNLNLADFFQTFYFADDKGYAGKGLLEPLAIVDAGAIIPTNAEPALQKIPNSIHVPKPGPLHILQAIMEHANRHSI